MLCWIPMTDDDDIDDNDVDEDDNGDGDTVISKIKLLMTELCFMIFFFLLVVSLLYIDF